MEEEEEKEEEGRRRKRRGDRTGNRGEVSHLPQLVIEIFMKHYLI